MHNFKEMSKTAESTPGKEVLLEEFKKTGKSVQNAAYQALDSCNSHSSRIGGPIYESANFQKRRLMLLFMCSLTDITSIPTVRRNPGELIGH